jgi:UDP-GlcNAc:undecaprenyl-phosphate/decaprenyl-phosphate GlcNAc-1-phosphate transferase
VIALPAFVTHVLFGAALTCLSAGLTYVLMKRVGLIDYPNQRSSHHAPTPRSGGIAIVATFFVGIAIAYLVGEETKIREPYFIGFVFSAIAITVVSFYDDAAGVSYQTKLLTQIGCAAVCLAFGLVIDQVPIPFYGYVLLGWLGYPITLLWIVGMTNSFNFMDGLDGLAASSAVIACAFYAYIAATAGSNFVYLHSYVVLAAALGFLYFNRPPARVFMGDIGSQFLGFTLAVLSIIGLQYDSAHVSFLVMPLLFFNFIWDTLFTLTHRLARQKPIAQAHREHLYQLLNQMGYSHGRVTLLHCGVVVGQGIGALILVSVPGDARLLVFLPFFAFQAAYTTWVFGRARKKGLLGSGI